jgi:hypothetical protein
MNRRTQIRRRLLAGLALGGAAAAGFAPPAHADSSGSSSAGSGSQVVGYNVTAEGIGAQFGFDIPSVLPLPNTNLVEGDVPFARTTAQTGPVVDSIGAPYYPGDLLGNLGGLESEFLPPGLGPFGFCPIGSTPSPPTCTFPVAGNYPLMARAEYPANSAYGTSAAFGPGAPPGSPVLPSGFAGAAQAGQTGGNGLGTVSDLVVGPGMGPGGAALLTVASEKATDAVNLGASTVSATASTVVKTISVVGMVDISEIDSEATSTSDGTTGTPTASLHIGQVTVAGQPAYIDNQGVHVAGNTATVPGAPTPAQLQSSLDATLAQDGVSIRVLDPQQTTNAAEGIANSGGLVISISHDFNVPFVNPGATVGPVVNPVLNNLPGSPSAQPCIPTQEAGQIPIPGIQGQTFLGNVCLPAGTYTAVTSITLGLASTDATASVLQQLSVPSFPTLNTPGDNGLGTLGGNGLTDLTSTTNTGNLSGPGTGSQIASAPARFPLRGIPAPLGWVIAGIILCVIFAYPMMLAARWQFLVGRR